MALPENNRSAISQLEGLLDLLVDLQMTGKSSKDSLPSNGEAKNSPDPQEASTQPSPIIESESSLPSPPQFPEEEGGKGREEFNVSSLSLLSVLHKEDTGDTMSQPRADDSAPNEVPTRLESLSNLLIESQPSEKPVVDSTSPSILENVPTEQAQHSTTLSETATNEFIESQYPEKLPQTFSHLLTLEESQDLSTDPFVPLGDTPPAPLLKGRVRGSSAFDSTEEAKGSSIVNRSGEIEGLSQRIGVSSESDHQRIETSASLPETLAKNGISSELATQPIHSSTHQSIIESQDADLDESLTPFERLQRLLITPEIMGSQEGIEHLKEKFASLEQQIYDPTSLINLLLPLITQILSLKIAEAREEMAQAIAPIIDEMIQAKAKEDKLAISAALAPVLPTAVTQQVHNFPGEFARAIGPEMSAAIKEQIDLERDAMVDALYPVIGSTISKYMAEAIAAINCKVENALSPEGISRKIRAKMQGISEAELIFKESMPFTIKAIFLIHKASGLVIAEIQPFGKQHLESEMVAGMLTAIRSFVNDCIAQSGEVSELDRIDYGNCEVILEVAGYCYLAVVTQGNPPQSFLVKMRQALSCIVQRYDRAIALFDGDPASVPEQIHQFLKSLTDVSTSSEPPKRKIPVALLVLGAAILSAIFVPWGIHAHHSRINRNLEEKTSLALASDPELAVYRLTVDATGDTLQLSGKLPNEYLVDKAGQIARTAAPKHQIENDIIAVKVPTNPVAVAAEVNRVTSILNQMERVVIWTSFQEGRVVVEGSVIQLADANKITEAFQRIPGVDSVTNTVQLQPLALASRIYFDLNSAELKSSELAKIEGIKAFLNDYPNQHLRLLGHSDPSGNSLENQRLALDRAKAVAEALIHQGINPKRLQVAGTAKPPTDVYADDPLTLSRFVKFEAIAP